MSKQEKAFQKVTDEIIKLLEKGIIPWRKPWNVSGEVPTNLESGRAYEGFFNRMFLNALPYDRPYFVTYNQAKKLGGNVKKGESGNPITFWKICYFDKESGGWLTKNQVRKLKREGKEDQIKTRPLLRYYSVFNVAQCEGLDDHLPELPEVDSLDFEPITQCEKIWEAWEDKPEVTHEGGRAFYRASNDSITMPENSKFISEEEYYSTLFHEGIHATGHESRCNRDLTGYFGTGQYSFEELVAEIGSAFLCSQAGIEKATIENSAAYIQGWVKKLKAKENNNWIVSAASKAKTAVEYIQSEAESNEERRSHTAQ